MKWNGWKTAVVVLLIALVAVVVASKNRSGTRVDAQTQSPETAPAAKPGENVPAAPPDVEKKLPKLLDLGAKKCIPCKMMAPLLEELAKDYKGKLDVEFIDVWQNPDAGAKYKIDSIPTQIFYDAEGKEFFRHVGFYPKEDILAKFKEKGISLGGENERPTSNAQHPTPN